MNSTALRTTARTAALGLLASLAFAGAADAGSSNKLTIKGPNGDFSGTLKTKSPARCAEGREVLVFKVVGSSPRPSVDDEVAMDDASKQGSRYRWSTGNNGATDGRYYAYAPRIDGCASVRSTVIRVSGRPAVEEDEL